MSGDAQLIAALLAAVGVLWAALSGLAIWIGKRLIAENEALKEQLGRANAAQAETNRAAATLATLVPPLVDRLLAVLGPRDERG